MSAEKYTVEDHPFGTFLPPGAKYLIIGTFPTFKNNFRFDFFYSGKDNLFWDVLGAVFNHQFQYDSGKQAVDERTGFLATRYIGITDMHCKCYREAGRSSDENLHSIVLTDIFAILDGCKTITNIIFTSRTDVFGAFGLFKTYLMQKGTTVNYPVRRPDKVLEGNFVFNEEHYKIFVPYSTSPKLIQQGITTKAELISMYRTCF